MGGTSGTSTTTMQNLPVYAESFVQSYLTRATAIAFNSEYDSAFSKYTGETYADMNLDETDAIALLSTRGENGNVTINKGKVVLGDILDGNDLYGNNVFSTVVVSCTTKPANTFNNTIRPLLGGSLYAIGDLSSENNAQNITSTVALRYNEQAQEDLYFNNYIEEKTIQNKMLSETINYGNEEYKDAETLRRAGFLYRVWQQGKYEADYRTWYEGEVLEGDRVEVLGNTIRSLVGTQNKRTEPYYRPSPMVSVMGGAVAGAGMGAMYGAKAGNPYAIAVGAVVGGLVGYLSS